MKKNKKAIIFGYSGQSQVVDFLLTHDSMYEVVAFTCSAAHRNAEAVYGKPLIDFENIELKYPPDKYEMFISIGYADYNKIRERFYYEAKNKGYKLLTYISSKATCWTDKIGDNTFIFEDNTVQPFVTIGSNVILWSGNHIGHHSNVADNCFISSHVVISGHCKIGRNTFIGVNSTIRDGITIGKENILGAGCLIVKDTEDGKTYIGTKATVYEKK